jgi:hypothetical protein
MPCLLGERLQGLLPALGPGTRFSQSDKLQSLGATHSLSVGADVFPSPNWASAFSFYSGFWKSVAGPVCREPGAGQLQERRRSTSSSILILIVFVTWLWYQKTKLFFKKLYQHCSNFLSSSTSFPGPGMSSPVLSHFPTLLILKTYAKTLLSLHKTSGPPHTIEWSSGWNSVLQIS